MIIKHLVSRLLYLVRKYDKETDNHRKELFVDEIEKTIKNSMLANDLKNENMTPREFRKEQEFEFDHFQELTSTGIKPNYVNIELFAHEYHQAKLKLLGIPDVVEQSEQLCDHPRSKRSYIGKNMLRCKCGKEFS